MLLETTYEGFENAGLRLQDIAGTKTSCYIGTFTADFPSLQARDNEGPSIYHATGTSASLASNRLSWFYDLKGPSMTIDTACSSSLTAFHLGCQSIRTGEAEMSVIAGANLMFGPDMSILLGAAKILSPEGKSKMWDASADGFARGEGIGVLILKPLKTALRDGDTIRSVVLATAANEDGWTPGISLPNSEAQQELIRTAYAQAGVDPSTCNYTEAHGTGTQAGDPLEAKAILNTIGANRTSDLYVGSVKTNIGHLEGAAGVAGVIKASLIVERGLIPRNLWFEKLNEQISLPDNVKIPLDTTAWPHQGPRRASINSFGFGGANAHVILEDAASYLARKGHVGRHFTTPRLITNGVNGHSNGANGISKEEPKSRVFALSSNDADGVARQVESLQSYLPAKPDSKSTADLLDNLAYTLGSKRTVLPWKSFAIASSSETLQKALGNVPAVVRSSNTAVPKIAFAFTGQGAQWWAMGQGLSMYKAFRESMKYSQEVLASVGCPWDLDEELNRSETDCKLRLTEYSQPACTALQVALVQLMRSWGVQPVAVVGHSSGEIAAAYTAGFISHEAAVKIAWLRGQVSSTVSKNGGMIAINASAETIDHRLSALTQGRAVVACMNSPRSCTVSGDKPAIDELYDALKKDEVLCTKLPMDVAYHSFHMEAARAQYEKALAGIPHEAPQTGLPMFSSVTGRLVTAEDMKPSYWIDNLVSPVNFTTATRALLHHTQGKTRSHDRTAFASVFVELGPHSALRGYLLDIFKAEDRFVDLGYASVLRRKVNGVDTALQAAGELWAKGCQINLNLVNEAPENVKMLVDLPPYSWDHSASRSFWDESYLSRDYRQRPKARTDLLGYRVPGVPDPTWRNFLRCNENPWIREHKVQGDIIYPGVGIVIMAVEAAKEIADINEEIYGYELRDVAITTALRVPDTDKGVEVQVQLHPRRTGTKAGPSSSLNELSVSSWSEETREWTVHARGLISLTYRSSLSPAMQKELELESSAKKQALLEAKEKCQRPARSFLYDQVENIGMVYGPTFRNMTELFAGPDSSYGIISIPDTKSVMPYQFEYPFVVHPATLDSILHLLFPCITGEEESLSEAVVPFFFDRVFISSKLPTTPSTKLQGHCIAKKTSYTTWASAINVCENDDEPLIIMEGVGLASIGGGGDSTAVTQESWASCFGQNWHEDVDLLQPNQIKEIVYSRTLKSKDDETVLDKLEYVCLYHIYRCLDWFKGEGKDFIPQDGFWKLYVEWMHDTIKDFPPLAEDPAEVQAELERCRDAIVHSPSGDITVQMVDRIGENLPKIFMREVEPLQVMTEGDLLYTFYRGAFGTSFNTNVAEYVGLIADKSPGVKILEIGAGEFVPGLIHPVQCLFHPVTVAQGGYMQRLF